MGMKISRTESLLENKTPGIDLKKEVWRAGLGRRSGGGDKMGRIDEVKFGD